MGDLLAGRPLPTIDPLLDIWQRYGAVLVWTVALLPVAIAVVLLLVRAGRPVRHAVAEVGAVWGTVPWLLMTLRPDPTAALRRTIHIVPFEDLLWLTPSQAPFQLVGNLFVLAALGAAAPVRFALFASVPRVAALAAACSLAIEVTQFALGTGRVSTVDDIMVNTLGAVLAALCTRRWWAARAAPVAPAA